MSTSSDLERCLSYIRTQLGPSSARVAGPSARVAITISRQTGTGGLVVAQKAAQLLETRRTAGERPWTVFDKNLVAEVLKEHKLPDDLARFMPEDRVSQLNDMVEEMLGLHPPSATLVRDTTETILHLAELGNVILVGRGANVITAQLRHVFHARLVGTLERRIERLAKFNRCSQKVARDAIKKSDRGRARYLARYFRQDIDDVLLYDLTINTDRIDDEFAAKTIVDGALNRSR